MPFLQPSQLPGEYARSNSPDTRSAPGAFQMGLGACGLFLILIAVWIAATEMMRAKVPYFVSERQQADAVVACSHAGAIGVVRGDVWLDDALACWMGLLAQGATANDRDNINVARQALVRAARLSPHESRVWLLRAAIESRTHGSPAAIGAALKMSYYTGASEMALIPLRASLAAEPDLAGDAELRSLLEGEIRTIAQLKTMQPLLAQAFRLASPDAQRELRSVVMAVAPELGEALQNGASTR